MRVKRMSNSCTKYILQYLQNLNLLPVSYALAMYSATADTLAGGAVIPSS